MESTVNKILVRSFYIQHAGFLLFLFIVFFGIVAPSQQLAYHYALIRGMLAAPVFLGLVMGCWLLYAVKVVQYVRRVLDSPEGLFLGQLRSLPPRRCYWLLWRVQQCLFLPVSGYAAAVIGVAMFEGEWRLGLPLAMYVLAVGFVPVLLYYRWLGRPGRTRARGAWRFWGGIGRRSGRIPYWSVLLRFLLDDNKTLLTGIKLGSCALLYLMLRQQTAGDYDLRTTYFGFSVALFGHGILLFRCRRLEATRGLWYRALPVSLAARLGQYAVFDLVLLLPEMLVMAWMTPHPIRLADTLELILACYSLLVLLGSFLLVIPLRVGDFLKLWLVIFGIWYACVLGGFLIAMSGLFAGAAVVVFFGGYNRFGLR